MKEANLKHIVEHLSQSETGGWRDRHVRPASEPLGGKFQAKSNCWNENRVFLEGDKLEVAVNNGRWVLTNLPAGPRPKAPPVQQARSPHLSCGRTLPEGGDVSSL
jgi:hypothetical protein